MTTLTKGDAWETEERGDDGRWGSGGGVATAERQVSDMRMRQLGDRWTGTYRWRPHSGEATDRVRPAQLLFEQELHARLTGGHVTDEWAQSRIGPDALALARATGETATAADAKRDVDEFMQGVSERAEPSDTELIRYLGSRERTGELADSFKDAKTLDIPLSSWTTPDNASSKMFFGQWVEGHPPTVVLHSPEGTVAANIPEPNVDTDQHLTGGRFNVDHIEDEYGRGGGVAYRHVYLTQQEFAAKASSWKKSDPNLWPDWFPGDFKPDKRLAQQPVPEATKSTLAMYTAARQLILDEIAFVKSQVRLTLLKVAKGPSEWSKHPNHKYHDALVEHYGPKLAQALKDSVTGLKPAIAAAKRKHDAAQAKATKSSGSSDAASGAAHEAMAHIAMDPKEARQILQWLYQDAYVAGAHTAADQIGHGATVAADLRGIEADIDWSTWEPGDAVAADLVSAGGLSDLLDQAGITIQSVEDSAMGRLENALADSLASGQSVDALARELSDIVSANADMIAQTETARAMSQATMNTYVSNGLEQYEWLAEDTACQVCQDNADHGPYDVSNQPDPLQPAHPNCRCAYVPVVLDADGNPIDFGDDGSADSDAPDESG